MPDYGTEPFEGFRIFRLRQKDSMLTSLAYDDVWMPGQIKRSECKVCRGHGYLKPAFKCSCGIWAVKSRKGIQATYPRLAAQNIALHEREEYPGWFIPPSNAGLTAGGLQIVFNPIPSKELFLSARVRLWGTVIEHTRGYRAEYAQIIPETIAWWPRRGRNFKPKLLAHIREKYHVVAQVPSNGGFD